VKVKDLIALLTDLAEQEGDIPLKVERPFDLGEAVPMTGVWVRGKGSTRHVVFVTGNK